VNKSILLFLIVVALAVVAFVMWQRAQTGDVGGLTFAQAGAQKGAAVAAAQTAAQSATTTGAAA
jgi:preprotein translocase subunit SecG